MRNPFSASLSARLLAVLFVLLGAVSVTNTAWLLWSVAYNTGLAVPRLLDPQLTLPMNPLRLMLQVLGGLTVAGLVLLALMAWVLRRQVSVPLGEAVEAIGAVARGDLTRPLHCARRDEIGQLLEAVEHMRGGLNEMMGALRRDAQNLLQRAHALAEAAQRSRIGAERQTEASSSIAASVEQLHAGLEQIRANAGEANAFSAQAGDTAERGGAVIHQASAEMRAIATQVTQSSKVVEALAAQSASVSEIVKVIESLADQTNLLSLNAAIEAARAGEHGRGFAVVADEVRKLAVRTREATDSIGEVVAQIQRGTEASVGTMREAASRVDQGVKLAADAQEAITRITGGAGQVVARIDDISASLTEQGQASTEISRAVETVVHMVECNSAVAGQVAASAADIEQLADGVLGAVDRFRISAG